MDPVAYFPLEISEFILQHVEMITVIKVSLLWRETALKSLRTVKEMTLTISKDCSGFKFNEQAANLEEKKVAEFQQCRSLRVPITSVYIREVYLIVFSLPQLKFLSVENHKWLKSYQNNLQIPVNYSINHLRLPINEISFMEVKTIVDKIPNMVHLEIQLLDQQTMEYISAKFRNLRTMRFRTVIADDFTVPDLFPNIQILKFRRLIFPTKQKVKKALEQSSNKFLKLLLNINENAESFHF